MKINIEATTDYGQFKKLLGNRGINPALVEKIANSITRENMLKHFPIKVNEKMEVGDGQHRLEAAKQLDVPIYYEVIKGLDFQKALILNTSAAIWSMNDYLVSHMEMGNQEYFKINKFIRKHGVSITTAIILLCSKYFSKRRHKNTGVESPTKSFKNGTIVVDNEEIADQVMKLTDVFRPYLEKQGFVHDKNFIDAVARIISSPSYDQDRMLEKLRSITYKIPRKFSLTDYIREIEDVYNKNSKSEAARVRFY